MKEMISGSMDCNKKCDREWMDLAGILFIMMLVMLFISCCKSRRCKKKAMKDEEYAI